MNYVKLCLQIASLYGIYLIGQGIQQILKLPIPGSIIGMLLLFCAFQLNIIKKTWLSLGGAFLLKNLPFLFIPATVGIIDYLPLFRGMGLITILIVFISTIVVMVISSYISDRLLAKGKKLHNDKGFIG